MLVKLIKLENIKQWQHNRALSDEFDKLNLIYGRNGSGKSTLGKLLEYINIGDVDSINSLAPIENNGVPSFSLLFNNGLIDLNSLENISDKFHIYNQSFIDKNLHSSKGVESSQLVNYYDFCLGSISVIHQKKIDALKEESKDLVNKINLCSSKITAQFTNKTVAQISKIKEVPDVDNELTKLNETLADIRNTDHFKKRKKLTELSLEQPKLDTSCFTISIEQLSKEAQNEVEKHINYNLKERDTSWLEDGLQLVTDNKQCPFCAQPLSGSPIFHLYQDFINESYLKASQEFEIKSAEFELKLHSIGVDLENLEKITKSNQEIIREWSDRLVGMDLEFNFKALQSLDNRIHFECRKLIESKEKDLLSTVNLTELKLWMDKLFNLVDFSSYNSKVAKFNNLVQRFIDEMGTLTSQSTLAKIEELTESKNRYKTEIINNLNEYVNLENRKKDNTKRVRELREKIAKEQKSSIGKHKDSINDLLKSFNSMIRIKALNRDNSGYKGATRITYIITFINKSLSIVADNERIFEHVLSNGDKSALALAFFLSKFKTVNSDNSIIVLDDPMTSLDIHRKNATVIEIANLVKNGYQTFILSHDPFFLSEVFKHSILSKDTKCYEIEASYNDIDPLDKHSTQYCSSKLVYRDDFESYVIHSYHREYNKLNDFVAAATEDKKVEVARSLRPILEAYLRFLFPTHFTQDIWLGGMISKIRSEENETSIFYDKANKLESIEKINEFSKAFHHSDGFDTKIQSLDIQTVKNYAKETLAFITGL